MTTVREILRSKGEEVWSVGPDTSVYAALELMAEKDVGAVLVLQEQRVVGIFSERDYARNVVLKGKSSRSTSVRELMSTRVLYVRLDQTIDDCMALITRKRIRHLPVMEAERLVGLVSVGDVVKQIIADREYAIQQLENYITGEL